MNNPNPPVFPIESYDFDRDVMVRDSGMTLRDYFAARGLETLMHKVASELESKHYSIEKAQKIQDVYASICYSMADAMLAAREKQ